MQSKSGRVTVLAIAAFLVLPVMSLTARGAAEPDGPVELRMNTLFHGGDAEAMRIIVERFNEEHDDIQIDLTQGSWDEYFAQLNNAVVAGEAPQIGIGLNFRMHDAYPALTPLNDSPAGNLLETYNFNRSDYVEAVWDLANFDGNQYGIPLDNTMLGIYYNKDLFEEVGLDPENPPQNMEEFIAAANALRDAGYYAFHPGAYGQARWYKRMWYINLWQMGGEILDGDRAAFNNELGERALEALIAVRENEWNEPGTNGAAQFDSGELGMLVNGTWHYLDMADVDFEWGMMGMPTFFDRAYTWGSNHFLVIPRQEGRDAERKVDAAARAIQWMSENSHDWGIFGGHVPLRQSALESSELRSSDAWEKSVGKFAEMAFDGTYKPMPEHPRINEINGAIAPYIEEAYNGTIGVSEALAGAESDVNDILRR